MTAKPTEKQPNFRRSAVITGIHDGDTVRVCLDLGKRIGGIDQNLGVGLHIEQGQLKYHTSCRLRGVNAPELATPAGPVSLAYVRDWLKAHAYPATADGTPGYLVMITTIRDETEKYGRLLVSIEGTKKPGVLNADLVADGQAAVFMATTNPAVLAYGQRQDGWFLPDWQPVR